MIKTKHILALVFGIVSLASQAQSMTARYGVVDMDSILRTIPEIMVLNQKVDSIQMEAIKASNPIGAQLQEKMAQLQNLQFSTDSVSQRSLQEDAQLLYQELNLIEQKARRAAAPFQQEGAKYVEKVTSQIKKTGEELNLTFVMSKEKYPMYLSFGGALVFDAPLYYSGEATDITDIIIKAMNPAMPTATKPKAKRK